MAVSIDPTRYRNAKELIEFTSSLDASETFRMAGYPQPTIGLAKDTTDAVVSVAKALGVGGKDLEGSDNGHNTSRVLLDGINDVRAVLMPHILLQPTHERAVSFVAHPKTAQAIAKIALHREMTLSGLIQMMTDGEFAPKYATPYLVAPELGWQASPKEGCPEARRRRDGTTSSVWGNFIPWVGRLTILSVMHHQGETKPAFAQSTSDV